MIHIATVHWRDADWIDIQKRFLDRHVPQPFRVYGWLDELESPDEHVHKFYYTRTDREYEHADKLNALADHILQVAESDSDVLIFIDSDAFPIAPLGPLIDEKLATHELIAIQRTENNGDKQPHPCFCITTVGFWRRIKGDWRRGYMWPDAQGRHVTDVGGNLLGILEKEGTNWWPLLRSNKKNPHPLLFGVYADVVYHHGAGSRIPVSREELKNVPFVVFFGKLHAAVTRRVSAHSLGFKLYILFYLLWCRIMLGGKTFQSMRAGREVMQAIRARDDFYRLLTE